MVITEGEWSREVNIPRTQSNQASVHDRLSTPSALTTNICRWKSHSVNSFSYNECRLSAPAFVIQNLCMPQQELIYIIKIRLLDPR